MCGPYGEWNEKRWRRDLDREITQVFNKFAGQKVNPADPNDPVLKEMRQEATMHYSTLRLVAPGTKPDHDDQRTITRINAELVTDGKGEWLSLIHI